MDRRDDGADDVQSEDSTEPKNGNREKLAADADDADAADAAETARWSPPWRRPGAAGQSIRPDRRHLRVFRPESAAPTLRTLRLGHPLPPLTLLLCLSFSVVARVDQSIDGGGGGGGGKGGAAAGGAAAAANQRNRRSNHRSLFKLG